MTNEAISVKALEDAVAALLSHVWLGGNENPESTSVSSFMPPADTNIMRAMEELRAAYFARRVGECVESEPHTVDTTGWRDIPHVREVCRSSTVDRLYWQADAGTACDKQPLPPPPGEDGDAPDYAWSTRLDRLVREIDVILHGEDGAAPQAVLCDLVGPIKDLKARCDKLEAAAKTMLAHLVAAVSVIERSEENGNHPSCAYGSDTMYQMAMKDFHKCMDVGRKALSSVVEGGK